MNETMPEALPLSPDCARSGPLPTGNDLEELGELFEAVAQARRSALLLDYDGTLAPFCDERQRAHPYPGVSSLLQRIMASGRTRVVIVTGRSAHEVVFLLGVDPFPEIWGSHGLQRLHPNGRCETPRIDARVTRALSEAGRWLADHKLQRRTEFKFGGIAVHWRGLPDASVTELRQKIMRAWARIVERASLSVVDFDGGVEIRASGFDKGDAVRTIVREEPGDAAIAYLGDDTTDESAFRSLGKRGLSILVRPAWRSSAAQLWLRPPDQMLNFLERWRQASDRRTLISTGLARTK